MKKFLSRIREMMKFPQRSIEYIEHLTQRIEHASGDIKVISERPKSPPDSPPYKPKTPSHA